MSSQIEQVVNGRMDIEKSLRLQSRFEPAHTSFANSSRLMRHLSTIIGRLRRTMDRLGAQFPMGNTVASQLIRHYRPRLIVMALDQTSEEALGNLAISARRQKHPNDFAILIDCTPQILLLALNSHEYLVDEEGIAVASVRAP